MYKWDYFLTRDRSVVDHFLTVFEFPLKNVGRGILLHLFYLFIYFNMSNWAQSGSLFVLSHHKLARISCEETLKRLAQNRFKLKTHLQQWQPC